LIFDDRYLDRHVRLLVCVRQLVSLLDSTGDAICSSLH
jgi:hypothetical protein